MMEKGSTTVSAASRDAGIRRYCAMGLGTAVLVGAVTTTDASVVFTNYNSLVLNDTNTTDALPTQYGYDVNGDGSQDFRFFVQNTGSSASNNFTLIVAGVNGSSLKPINVVGISVPGTTATFNYPSRLAAGAVIGATRPFVTLSLTASGSFLNAGTFAYGNGFANSKWKTAGSNSGFLGFSFSAADGLHYGYAQLTVAPQGNGALSRSITLNSIAYESAPNTAITTVPVVVPEPSSLALAALGGAGILAYRRRKAAAKAAATVEA